MKNLKKWIILGTSIIMTVGMSMVVYAQDVTHVKVTFSGTQPYEGEAVTDVEVKGGDNSLYDARVAGYQNNEATWSKGDTPRVVVELYTEGEDTVFTHTGSSHFSLNGMGASYRSANIDDDGHHMELVVTLDRVSGDDDLDICDNIWWEGRTAHWDKIDGANRYEVQLYRDDNRITTIKTENRHYNFNDNMDKAGTYYFRIRGIDGSNKGGWSDWSDDYDVEKTRTGNNSNTSPDRVSSGWQTSPSGKWYQNADGSYPYNAWLKISNKWYFFNSKGYMTTGWVQWKGIYYYLGSDGAMYVNTTTPDGYKVDGTGAWIQNQPTVQEVTPDGTQSNTQSSSTNEDHHVTGFAGGPGV